MAKINHNNFVDTINDGAVEAKKRGVVHLEFTDTVWRGDTLEIQGRELVNFGTCGYLGLESHPTITASICNYATQFGSQFSVSRSYLVSKQNLILESKLSEIYGGLPTIVFTSTTLAHLSVLPIMVGHDDAIILDQQCHISIQTAAQQLASKGVPLEIIRHSNLEMLEHKVKSIYDKYKKIWYMIDGVYSMYGDVAPIEEINQLLKKYDKLHLYVDDAHGMSWSGPNGSGRLFSSCSQNGKTMYMSTLAKGFGTMGGIAVFPQKSWYDKLILHGGPLAYSHPLPPPMMGASIASADIHLSPEINKLQLELTEKLEYANNLFAQTDLPILSSPETPIYFVGTGQPHVGYNLNKRIIDEGFYVNIGMFPAVPAKNTGLRFTITNHNSKQQIKQFIDALSYHYPKALSEEGKTVHDVRKAFRMKPGQKEIKHETRHDGLILTKVSSIQKIDKDLWNYYMEDKSLCDWNNLKLLESAFTENQKPVENWEFIYLIIQDEITKKVILCTFFTIGIFKDDLLARESVSKFIESRRIESPYYLTSRTLVMGCAVTEGDQMYLDREHKLWHAGFHLMLEQLTLIQEQKQVNTILLRDFDFYDIEISEKFYENGFTKISLPNSNEIEKLDQSELAVFFSKLSKNGRSNLRRYAIKNEPLFEVEFKSTLTDSEMNCFWELYNQVVDQNYAINLFAYPQKFFQLKNETNNWEFIILRLKSNKKIVSCGSCYMSKTGYCPVIIGIDYMYNSNFKIYKQMLYQAVKRAHTLGYSTVKLGLTADTDKKDVGASPKKRVAFIQSIDNFNFEIIENCVI